MRRNLIAVLCVGAGIYLTFANAAPQQSDATTAQKATNTGRGNRRKGPPGPVPRLADGKRDLSAIWNTFGSVGREQKAPNMLPWAEAVVERHVANDSAEDFEARCLPGGLPEAISLL